MAVTNDPCYSNYESDDESVYISSNSQTLKIEKKIQ